MKKSDLVLKVSDIADISSYQAENAVAAMLEHIPNALARGESVNLIGFGRFIVKHRAARKGRNPKTGEEMLIPASNGVQFKAGKYLKDAVNHSVNK